jgi:hypothetical protein
MSGRDYNTAAGFKTMLRTEPRATGYHRLPGVSATSDKVRWVQPLQLLTGQGMSIAACTDRTPLIN